MKNSRIILVSGLLASGLLTACGGGGGGATVSEGDVVAAGGVIVITAMDGYYQNALIFDDVNDNGQLDIGTDTIYGLTDENGQLSQTYASSITSELQGALALQTIASGGAIQSALISAYPDTYDASIYTIDTDYPGTSLDTDMVLRAPSSSVEQTSAATSQDQAEFSAVISPISDLVSIQIDSGLTEEEAENTVAEALDIPESSLYDNYIESDDDETHKKAQILSESKAYNEDAYDASATEVAMQAATTVSSMTDGDINDTTNVPVIIIDPATGSLTVETNTVATVESVKLEEIQADINALDAVQGGAIEEQFFDISGLFSDSDQGTLIISSDDLPDETETGIYVSVFNSMLTISATEVLASDDLTFNLYINDISSEGTDLGKTIASFTLPINGAPTIVSTEEMSLQEAVDSWSIREGEAFSDSFSVSGLFSDTENDSLTYSVLTTVTGLNVTVNNDGLVSVTGTPALADTEDHTITVEATDGSNVSSVTFTLAISENLDLTVSDIENKRYFALWPKDSVINISTHQFYDTGELEGARGYIDAGEEQYFTYSTGWEILDGDLILTDWALRLSLVERGEHYMKICWSDDITSDSCADEDVETWYDTAEENSKSDAKSYVLANSTGVTSIDLTSITDPVLNEYFTDLEYDFIEQVEGLFIEEMDVESLTGISQFTGLQDVVAANNHISDISPLGGLSDMDRLNIGWQTDATTGSDLNLQSYEPIYDMTSLTRLNMSEYGSDVPTAPFDLALFLAGHTDKSSMTRLQLYGVEIDNSDLSSITGMPNITRLNLEDIDAIDDLTLLEGNSWASLTRLQLSWNNDDDLYSTDDEISMLPVFSLTNMISAGLNLAQLETLELPQTTLSASDITTIGLGVGENLESLQLRKVATEDFSGLLDNLNAPNLYSLKLGDSFTGTSEFNMENIDTKLTPSKLTKLYLQKGQISNLDIEDFSSLEILRLNNSNISDTTVAEFEIAVNSLTNLNSLNISGDFTIQGVRVYCSDLALNTGIACESDTEVSTYSFATDELSGRTFYNLFSMDKYGGENPVIEGSGWEMDEYTFTSSTFTIYNHGTVDPDYDRFDGEIIHYPYQITDEGYIEATDPTDHSTIYVRGFSENTTNILIAAGSLDEVTAFSTHDGLDYVFYDEDTARQYALDNPLYY
jgi:hypothetical protein